MLKFYVRQGIMIVEKRDEKISFGQNKSLEKYLYFYTKKQNEAKMILKKTSIIYLIMPLLVG